MGVKMKLRTRLKLEDIFEAGYNSAGHIASAVFAAGSTYKAFNEDYERAAIYGIMAAFIQFYKYRTRKEERKKQEIRKNFFDNLQG